MTAPHEVRDVVEQVALEDVVRLLEEIVPFPSFSGDEGGVAHLLAARMRDWGFDEVWLQDVEPGRPNVFGALRGDGSGPTLMLNGHLDIDPLPDGYDRPPWECQVEGDRLYGAGVGNMKGGLAALVMAAVAVKRSGARLKGDLVVAGVVGELQGGIGTCYLLEHGPVPDVVIVPEPTNLQVRTLHAGVLEVLVTVFGRAVWVGQLQRPPSVNAIEKALRAMRALEDMSLTHEPHPELPGLPRINVGAIRGGLTREHQMWRPAYVPDCATLAADIRLHPGMTVEGVVADLRRVLDGLAAHDPEFRHELELPPATYREPWRAMAHYMPPLEIPREHPLVQLVAQTHERVTGETPPIGRHVPGSHAGADSGHFWAHGIPALNYGPTQHSRFKNEVALSKLDQGTRVLAEVAAELCTSTRDELEFETRWKRRI